MFGDGAADLLRAVASMNPQPMVLADPNQADYPLVFCNPAFCRLTGYEEQDVLGRNCRFLQGEMTDPNATTMLRAAIEAERETQVEMWNYRRDGSRFWCSMFVGPVRDGEGRLLYWFGSQLDTTARREVDETRASAQRMDTLGLMAAGMAHEFNNLMTVVLANAEGARIDPLTLRQAERLDRVGWAARAAGRLTQQMLSFAGRQSLRAEIVDLNAVIRDFDGVLAQACKQQADFEIELCDAALPAKVDLGQLELALINLVRNASDASDAGSRIRLATRATEMDNAAAVEICVVDQGSGMDSEVAGRAVEPFFTTKTHGSGTGLGLSMVSGFAEQSGGRMIVETAPGIGTTVRLVFPGHTA